MNAQGNDLALAAGTPIYALNASFTREGVAERRRGFQAFWDGLPICPVDGYDTYGKFHELLSKEHLFMPFSGMMFTYDEVNAASSNGAQWFSVPVNLPHRMRTLYSDETNAIQFHSLGRAVIARTADAQVASTSPAWNWQSDGSIQCFAGTIGNDASAATDATAVQNLKFITAFDVVTIGARAYISDDTTIRSASCTAIGGATVFVGSITSAGSVNNTGTVARFSGASWMATDGTSIYVADNLNQIRKVTQAGAVTTLCGSVTAGDVDGDSTVARFRNISGLAWSGSFLFVSEGSGAHRIRRVNVTSGSVSIFAGSLTPDPGYVNDTGTNARFNTPIGLEYINGVLYTGDTVNNAVRAITASAAVVTTVAGNTGASASTGMVGGWAPAALLPSVTVRSMYAVFDGEGVDDDCRMLCLECAAPNNSIDLGLMAFGDASQVPQVWHYARTPDSLPTATTGPIKLDTVGPNAYTLQDVRSADIGSGTAFTTSEKPRVLDVYNRLNPTDPFPRLRPLGIEAPEVPSVTTTSGSTFATLTAAAYRTLCGLKLPDGRIILGPPSPRVVLTNATGGALAGSVTAYPSAGLPYDGMTFLQVYRTRTVASTVDPGDQMFLCYEAPLSYGAGVVFTDITPDDLLGAELSTNATQDGFAYAPLPPPLFADEICEFQNSCVLANYNERASVRVKMLGVSSIVNGTSTVTFTTTGPGNADACETLVLTAGTVTSVSTKVFGVTTGGSAATNAVATAKEIVRVINRNPDAMMFSATYDDNDPGAFIVYSWHPGRSKTGLVTESSGSVTLTQSQVTFATTATTNLIAISQAPSQRQLNAVAYSDVFTADAFPVVNTRLLSASQEPILRLLPIAEALIAVKTDATWRYDQSFTEQIYDTSLRCIWPDSFAKLNNAWIGVFSCGFVKLSASQGVRIGRPIERVVVPLLGTVQSVDGGGTGVYTTTAFGAAVDSQSSYCCSIRGLQLESIPPPSWHTFVYNDIVQAWSEWRIGQTEEDTIYGIGVPGSWQESFLANISKETNLGRRAIKNYRGVLRGRDARRRASTNTPIDFSDVALSLTNVVISGTSFVGSFTQSANMLESPPPASSLVGGWLAMSSDSVVAGVVVASATIVGTSILGSLTQAGEVFSEGPMQLYAPINFGCVYAPVFAPANAQFGDVVVTLERIRGGSITCEFFNRYDVMYPYNGIYALASIDDGPYYPAIYSRTNSMSSAVVPSGPSSGSIGSFAEDVQRFTTPIERATDQTLTVGLFEQKAAAPTAIKGVVIDYAVNDGGKVKQ